MKRFFSTCSCLILLSSTAFGQDTVNMSFGSRLDFAGRQVSFFTDQDGVGFSDSNLGYIAVGYFSDEANLASNVSAFNTGAMSLDTFLTDFTVLSDSDFESATFPGYLPVNSGSYIDDGSGFIQTKTPYIITLEGITQWSDRLSADGIGLFGDSSYGQFDPYDDGNPLAVYDTQSLTFDSKGLTEPIFLGTETLGVNADSFISGLGFTSNNYGTQAIGAAVPEPSTYALMLGVASFGFVYYRRKVVSKKSDKTDSNIEA